MSSNLAITDDWEFKLWFGDSKVIDKNSKPLVVFHGTWKCFPIFNVPDYGVYFTDNFLAALSYGEVVKVYLSMQKPLILNFEGELDMSENWNIEDEVIFAKEEGFDGLVVYNSFDGENFLDQFVAFNSSQIRIV